MDTSWKSTVVTAAVSDAKMGSIDFKKICRICGKSEETLTSVHSRYQNDLRGKIAKYLNIDIAENDTLPTKICFCCKDIITKWHDLFEKCRIMEERFVSILKPSKEDTVPMDTAQQDSVVLSDRPAKESAVHENNANVTAKDTPIVPLRKQDTKDSLKVPTSATGTVACTFCKSKPTGSCVRFETQTALVDHMKDEHWDQIFHCEQCDNYLDRAILIEHMTMHALSLIQPAPGAGEGEQEPDSIGSAGSGLGDDEPEGELEEADGSQQTTEPKSGEGSTNKENDDKDPTVPDMVKPVETRKLYCYICEKTLANRSAYSYHVNQVHLNIKNVECSFCEKKFGNRRLLNNHIANVHSRERNFGCTVCDKRFKTNVALYNHMRVHDDKLQFSCRFCDKKFRFRNHLVSHELVHLDERNFSCNQCEKKFNTNECLQKHKLTHVTTEPYQCPLCGFSTKQKRYLVMHAKRIHMVR
ncbi:zinc finger protein 62 homolog [Anopheles nili]|uniref:zinc finger protein 62 homolog n=1 Tax=Anopheles nili TaxID=185578 RepID=UPI00237AB4CB|nr:zinc finger protein 62 homolog [Anopheles nili]